jgi:hypothetical protein
MRDRRRFRFARLVKQAPVTQQFSNHMKADPIEALRIACAEAGRIDALQTSADSAALALEVIREKLAMCDDERKLPALTQQLSEAETAHKVAVIRANKGQAAWRHAVSLVSPALSAMNERVTAACGSSFDTTAEVFKMLLGPEAAERVKQCSFEFVRIEHATGELCGSGLACALANLVQHDLRWAARGYPSQPDEERCSIALRAIEKAQEALPEIARQAALLKRIQAAVSNISPGVALDMVGPERSAPRVSLATRVAETLLPV